jgi:3-deoxy-manno-octulosonate cytidylyltransferase (CMP-KDO synthetase)
VENLVENFRTRRIFLGKPAGLADCTKLVRHARTERGIIDFFCSCGSHSSRAGKIVVRFTVPVVLPAGLPHTVRSARVVAIIPSRYRSTRLPGKPLAMIAGKTMVEHVYRRAAAATRVDAVVVATDDERVAEVVSAFGGTAVMTRDDHATGTDRLAEVSRALEGDIVVNVQGDEPIMTAEAIDAVVTLLQSNAADVMATLRRRVMDLSDLDNPSVVKLVADNAGYALYFTRSAIPFVRPGLPAPVFWRHLGLYAYRRAFLATLAALPSTPLEQAEGLEQLRALEHGYRISTAETQADTIGVDTPEDLERVRQHLGQGDSRDRQNDAANAST